MSDVIGVDGLPPAPDDELPMYPGPHPGTGKNDHVHAWTRYRAHASEGWVVIEACQICGAPRQLQGDG